MGIANRYSPHVPDFGRFSHEVRPPETIHRIVIGFQIWKANSFGQNCLKPILQNWKKVFLSHRFFGLTKIGESNFGLADCSNLSRPLTGQRKSAQSNQRHSFSPCVAFHSKGGVRFVHPFYAFPSPV